MKTITILLFGLLTINSYAQVEGIDSTIAEYDAKIAQAIVEETNWAVPHISTTCPLMLPAIGLVNNEIDIYFDHFREESDIDGEDLRNVSTIRKVSFQILSGSYQINYIYYFDMNGQVICHSERVEDAEYGCTLTSYYFEDDKFIQLKSELLATAFCELPTENAPEIRTELSAIEKFTVKWIHENSARFKSLLALYMDIMIN